MNHPHPPAYTTHNQLIEFIAQQIANNPRLNIGIADAEHTSRTVDVVLRLRQYPDTNLVPEASVADNNNDDNLLGCPGTNKPVFHHPSRRYTHTYYDIENVIAFEEEDGCSGTLDAGTYTRRKHSNLVGIIQALAASLSPERQRAFATILGWEPRP